MSIKPANAIYQRTKEIEMRLWEKGKKKRERQAIKAEKKRLAAITSIIKRIERQKEKGKYKIQVPRRYNYVIKDFVSAGYKAIDKYYINDDELYDLSWRVTSSSSESNIVIMSDTTSTSDTDNAGINDNTGITDNAGINDNAATTPK